MKKCCICKEVKPYECFTKNKNRKDGYELRCKECRKNDYTNEFISPIGRASHLRRNCLKRSKEKGLGEVTVTKEWIAERIVEGCPLTGITFNLTDANSPHAPSLDRIDSSKGYTKENTRVIVAIANFCKNIWNDEDMLEFAEKLIEKRS